MQTLPTELPEKLKDKLLKVVCDGMDCHLEYCEEPCMKVLNTVNAIHKAYYEYQIEELKKLDIVTPEEAQKRVEKIQHDFRGSYGKE